MVDEGNSTAEHGGAHAKSDDGASVDGPREGRAREGRAREDGTATLPTPKRPGRPKKKKTGPGSHPNNVRQLRVERMMSKAELARRAGLSVLTVDRVEKGHGCRMDTKRKILQALELSLGDRVRVFGEIE
jgi:DNA-binding Xre family transcriptional regulator